MQVNWIENDSVINSMRRKQVMSQNWPFQLHLSDCTQHRSTCNLQKLDWNCFLCCQLDSNAKSKYTGCVSNFDVTWESVTNIWEMRALNYFDFVDCQLIEERRHLRDWLSNRFNCSSLFMFNFDSRFQMTWWRRGAWMTTKALNEFSTRISNLR